MGREDAPSQNDINTAVDGLVDIVLEKPWKNLKEYVKARLDEAVVELRLALVLLAEGYTRNAAGKAFQAFKSYLAAVAGEQRDKLAASFKDVDRIIAYMPTRAVAKISSTLGLEREGRIALALHQYQYNGPDPEGVMSLYPDRESAKNDICWLAKRLMELIGTEIDTYIKVCNST